MTIEGLWILEKKTSAPNFREKSAVNWIYTQKILKKITVAAETLLAPPKNLVLLVSRIYK